jgi:flagellar motility protein MotE (MotC chaperone)
MAKELKKDIVEELKEMRTSQSEIQLVLGDLYVQSESIKVRQQELLKNLGDVNQSLKAALDEIREEYGDGSIDLDKGLFLPGE